MDMPLLYGDNDDDNNLYLKESSTIVLNFINNGGYDRKTESLCEEWEEK